MINDAARSDAGEPKTIPVKLYFLENAPAAHYKDGATQYIAGSLTYCRRRIVICVRSL